MSITLFLILLFSLTTIYFIIGLITSSKVTSVNDYFLANRQVGILPLTFTLVATQLGSGLLLGTAARAYSIGLWGILYTLGISIGFLILGFGFAARLQSLNIATTAEIFETRYHSPKLKMFASLVSIISLWGILVAQIIASHQLFLSCGIEDPRWLLCFWALLIGYTMLGGLRSVIIIDTLQVGFILIIFSVVFYYALPKEGLTTFTMANLIKMQNYYFTKKYVLSALLPVVVSSALFSLIEQDLAQKFFAARTAWTATIAAFLSSIIITIFACIPLYFGIFAKIKNIAVPAGVSPLLPFIEKISSEWVYALVVCALIAAIASTADSLLCAISSHIAQDFSSFLPTTRKLLIAKFITFITGACALGVSFYISGDIISVLEQSYRFSISCLFVPTIIAYFTENVRQGAALVAIVCGSLSFIGAQLFLPHSILQDIIPLALSLLGYILGAILSEK
ncbi:sodium:solute symporter family protein [Candidatus Babeliales bacterium]|nr:sodium:solute symporter family protein [Candidatus Babeliales bacterium]MBP9844213.1 sodium:solute symporter family protein [Candidatus Babeliales bacterium]